MNFNPLTRHQHGGKWSEEEELYAAALMEAFKAGDLPASDCPEGTSLRKYLAKKLLCSPKRVSKKYEGTGYNGKQVFERSQFPANPVLELARRSELELLESKFLGVLAQAKCLSTSGPAKVIPTSSVITLQQPNAYELLPLRFPNNGSTLRGATTSQWPQSSVAAQLQARSRLDSLIHQRDMLDDILSQPLKRGNAAGFIREESRIAGERLRQAALVESLTKHRFTPLTSANFPVALDYQSLLNSASVLADSSSARLCPPGTMAQARGTLSLWEQRLTKRPLLGEDTQQVAKRPRPTSSP